MLMLAHNPAAAYRRVELDARIEASSAADLTRICLEEAVAALGLALLTLERSPDATVSEPLTRAQSITVWLARSVAPEHPLYGNLVTFYGGLARQIGANLVKPRAEDIARVRGDLNDLLVAAAG
jgi:flagellin-specific chaperone FliS